MPKKDTDMIDDVLSIYNYAEQKLLGVLAKHADNMTANKQLDQVQAFKKEITNENFVPVIIKEKKDLWDALKTMLRKELKEEE